MAARSGLRAGFTLFEVMAAVLILGVLYTVLATSAIDGLRVEGESRRRLEASLMADDQLVDLESGLDMGVFPEVGVEESEEGAYHVRVEVTPFDITPYLGDELQELQQQGAADSLLAPPDRPEDSLIRLISVVVAWDEPDGEHTVDRLTLAYDQATIGGLLPEAEASGGAQTQQQLDDDTQSQVDNMLNLLQGAQ